MVQLETIRYFQGVIRDYDFPTYTHCQKVAGFCLLICNILGLDNEQTYLIINAALIHDIGKVALPIELLNQEEPLSTRDLKIIQTHPAKGVEIISQQTGENDKSFMDLILFHHERIDGYGYPNGIRGVQIPFGSRIMAIADALDAMVTYRPYRNSVMSMDEALVEIKDKSGSQFDAAIGEKILRSQLASIFTREGNQFLRTAPDHTTNQKGRRQ
jgi:HD-GYP domain-containing protein (c-di-GMP phosphodiesterase class II)